jgi:hypothetical protein
MMETLTLEMETGRQSCKRSEDWNFGKIEYECCCGPWLSYAFRPHAYLGLRAPRVCCGRSKNGFRPRKN